MKTVLMKVLGVFIPMVVISSAHASTSQLSCQGAVTRIAIHTRIICGVNYGYASVEVGEEKFTAGIEDMVMDGYLELKPRQAVSGVSLVIINGGRFHVIAENGMDVVDEGVCQTTN